LKGTAGDDTRFFIEDSGDIGIGTTSPDEKFHVDGNIIAEGDIIATGSFKVNGQALNVPDYVFDSDYDLMALNEIELFIEDNGHLPDIPSAQEVKSEGLDVSITLMKLLAKIEELTLHTIKQQKTISALQKRVEFLGTAIRNSAL
jgi:hypothetical protein